MRTTLKTEGYQSYSFYFQMKVKNEKLYCIYLNTLIVLASSKVGGFAF